jgi:hypothetical protein
MRTKPMDMDWLMSRSEINENGCWIWQGFKHKAGYGEIRRNQKRILAHRQAFFIANGYMPEVCRHKCDVRACVNPDHLEDGTHADNVRDRDERGRGYWKTNEEHGRAKFSNELVAQVREMRESGMTQQAIADATGVSQTHVSYITRGAGRVM